jgi:ribosomal protein S18 acetylase RimI-like enzyme
MKTTMKKWIIILLLGLGAVVGTGCVYYCGTHEAALATGIYELDKNRDSAFIIKAFKDDWHWLVEGTSFSPQQMLETRGYPQNGLIRNNLSIKAGYEDGKPTGFVAYYMKSMFGGRILFIWVAPEFRSKRWGRRLLDYAVQDLLKRGATRIELVTRIDNEASQRLYNRYGFKEFNRYAGFVEFEYKPGAK